MKEFTKNKKSITDRSNKSVAIYLREINHNNPLTTEEETELFRKIRKGGKDAKAARERLINANLKFVITVANRYNSPVLEQSDLISEGNLGLLKAINHFDETKGHRFISYAVWWIRQSIIEAVNRTNTTLRLPQNQQSILNRFKKMQEEVLLKEQRYISIEEFCEKNELKYKSVARVVESALKPVYMDRRIAEENDNTFGDFIVSDSVSDIGLEKESLHYDVLSVMGQLLSTREEFILKNLYGIDCEPITLEEIADKISITPERARQIHLDVLKKLRNSPYSSRLSMHLAA